MLGLGELEATVRAAEKLPPLLPPEGPLPPTFWEQHALAAALALGAILLGLALLVWWWRQPRPAVEAPPALAIRRDLQRLRDRPEDFGLLSDVSRLLRRYLTAAVPLTAVELTTDELSARLRETPWLGPDLAAALIEFCRRCDSRRFSPHAPMPPMGAVDRALALMDEIEARRTPPNPAPDAMTSSGAAAAPAAPAARP
ncbi:MAG: DUF4381 family protein [Verrucomicrobia bacterium]|nr:DUF4381 family protein [Verrucomicrobiota bacterium]